MIDIYFMTRYVVMLKKHSSHKLSTQVLNEPYYNSALKWHYLCCVCVGVCVCVCACACACACVRVRVHAYAWMHACVRACACVISREMTYLYDYVCLGSVFAGLSVCRCVGMCVCIMRKCQLTLYQ